VLVSLARLALREALRARPLPEPAAETLTPTLTAAAATFVTLTLEGQLRGCVGNIVARDPLYRSVMRNAVGAALRDTRFTPVTLEEADRLAIHVSLLSPATPRLFDSPEQLLAQLEPGGDGVILRLEGRVATFLPQVWKTFDTGERFMEALSRKAGLREDAWRTPGAEVSTYRVTSFGDPPSD